jgi:hypothetical protein
MVSCPYRYDTVDDMDIGDGDRDGSPVRTTNLPSSSLANANNQLEIRTFSYYAIVGLGEIAQRSGGCGRETLKLGVGFGCYVCIGNLHFETARPRDVFLVNRTGGCGSSPRVRAEVPQENKLIARESNR